MLLHKHTSVLITYTKNILTYKNIIIYKKLTYIQKTWLYTKNIRIYKKHTYIQKRAYIQTYSNGTCYI